MNNQRERLIELMEPFAEEFPWYQTAEVADYLLANGVIVPPVKVGDTVWEITTENPFEEDLCVRESKIERFLIVAHYDLHSMNGETIFPTKEEAEAALERSRE